MSLLMEALRKAEQVKKQAAGVDNKPQESADRETHPDNLLPSKLQPSMKKDEDADTDLELSGHDALTIEGGNEEGTTETIYEDTGDTLDVWELEDDIAEITLEEEPASFNLHPEDTADSEVGSGSVNEFPTEDAHASDIPEPVLELQPAPVVPFIATADTSVEASRQTARAVFIAKTKHRRQVLKRRLLLAGVLAGVVILGVAGYLFFSHRTMMNFTAAIVPVKGVAPPQEPAHAPKEATEVEPVKTTPSPPVNTVETSGVNAGSGPSEQKSAGDRISSALQTGDSLSQSTSGSSQAIDGVPRPKIVQVSSSSPISVPPSRQDVPAASQREPEPYLLPEHQAAPSQPAIRVTHHESRPQIDPLSEAAYASYQHGNFEQSRRNYQLILQAEPEHRGAMLGLAALAMHGNEAALARDLYLRLLERDPSDPLARAGLLAVMPTGDPTRLESELKLLLELHPNVAPLFFSLGNLYAAGQRWNEAQQAYFNALQAAGKAASRPESISPDYPFNLAVSLDHLNQSGLAIRYYREALRLAADHPAGFDKVALRQRLENLNQGEMQ